MKILLPIEQLLSPIPYLLCFVIAVLLNGKAKLQARSKKAAVKEAAVKEATVRSQRSDGQSKS